MQTGWRIMTVVLYGLTVFIGSFLLFQVEPLIGRYILPWYGGGPAVWTTCMLFFQVVLLGGYGYAHGVALLPRRRQGWTHLFFLVLSLVFLPIAPSPDLWKPVAGDDPVVKILLLLLANVGLPYLVLSATAPLVQHWFAGSFPGRSPYRLYALSNLASMLALLSYPFLVEPNLTLARQIFFWEAGFVCFLVFAGACSYHLLRPGGARGASRQPEPAPSPGSRHAGSEPSRPGAGSYIQWLLLSAFGSIMLLATTNQLCQNVAVVPFLWVMPLALYLATFTIAFNSDRASNRLLSAGLLLVSFPAVCYQLMPQHQQSLVAMIAVYLLALFSCCLACHCELARSRPEPRHLTAYYLTISLGGALGGGFVAVVAPLVFSDFWEYPLALAGSLLVLGVAWYRGGGFRTHPRLIPFGLALLELALCVFLGFHIFMSDNGSLATFRNFYGVMKVYADQDVIGNRLVLLHGQIKHGWQYEGRAKLLPTAYYGTDSGAGLALRYHPRRFSSQPERRALRVGVIGLGVGTLASYGQPGDVFRFYEINPAVIGVAQRYFSYLRDSAARLEFVPGDARVVLESELKRSGPQRFDVLVVDAFNGDAVPMHLLTRECFQVYRQHLNPDGLLLVHISNRYLDLAPVVHTQGRAAGYLPVDFKSEGAAEIGTQTAFWVALLPDLSILYSNDVAMRASPVPANAAPLFWTDDFASLWHVVRK